MTRDLVSRKNFMLLGLSVAAVGLEAACSSPDAGPPSNGGNTGGNTGSGGAMTGGATTGGATTGGATTGGATTGGATSGGATSGGASAGGATSGGTGQGGSAGGSGGAIGGSSGSAGSGGAGGMCLAVAIEISCNHDGEVAHTLTIPVEDVMAGTDKPYVLSDTGTHDHDIMLTAAHFTTLRNGGTVHLYAPSQNQPHCVTITCGVATDPTTLECAEDSTVCG